MSPRHTYLIHLDAPSLTCTPGDLCRNDAVVPVNGTYAGCDYDADGLCSFDNVVSVLKQRIDEIDYDYDCFANYTASAGFDYNGRAPR